MQLAGGSDGSDDDWQVVPPGQTLTAPLVVSPPRGAAVPGQLVPFSVRARSPASSRPAAVTTGIVLFSAPVPVTAALLPASARAPGASQHVVELTTDDAVGVLVTLHGTTGAAATVTVDPVAVRVQPGSPARADVVVRPRRPALWGTRRHSFEVVWETDVADGLARGTVPGRLEQRPVLPRPVTVLLLLGVLGVLGLGVAQLRPSDDRGAGTSAGGGEPGTPRSSSSPAEGTDTPLGPVALVHTQLKGSDPEASRRVAEQFAAAVQVPAGTQAIVVDAATVPGATRTSGWCWCRGSAVRGPSTRTAPAARRVRPSANQRGEQCPEPRSGDRDARLAAPHGGERRAVRQLVAGEGRGRAWPAPSSGASRGASWVDSSWWPAWWSPASVLRVVRARWTRRPDAGAILDLPDPSCVVGGRLRPSGRTTAARTGDAISQEPPPLTAPTEHLLSTAAARPEWQQLPEALRSPAGAERLIADYVDHSAADDLLERAPADLAAAVASHVRAGLRRLPGSASVRVVDGAVSGAQEQRTTVEVVTDDMPFLVDSLTSALTGLGRGISTLAHPRFAARRDHSGALLDLHPADRATSDDVIEAWIRLEVDRLPDDQAHLALVAQLRSVLDDVRVSVRDWPAMQDRALETADDLVGRAARSADPQEAQVAARFLRWLADDRFTFLGCAEHDLPASDEDGRLLLRPGTGLGLLSPGGDGGERARALAAALPVEPTTRTLRVTKAGVRSPVHRSAYLDCVCVLTVDRTGQVTGERRFLGLFTSGAYTESVRRVPLVAEKVTEVLQRAGFAPGSHSARDLLSVLEFFPRDELMQAEVEDVLRTALGVLHLQERRRTRLFLRADPSGFTSCLVFLPRDRYTTSVGVRVEHLLCEALDGGSAEHTLHVTESALARLHVVVRPRPGEQLHEGDEAQLEAAVARAVRSWEDDLLDAARSALPEPDGVALVRRWARGLPEGYRADVPPARALEDLRQLEALVASVETPATTHEGSDGGTHEGADGGTGPAEPSAALALREPVEGEPRTWRLSLYRLSPVTLSAVLPYLADLGVEVTDERPHALQRADGRAAWVYDVGLRLPRELWQDEDSEARSRFGAAFAAAWSSRAESDALNRLVLAAQLSWEQVAVVRALVRYLRQTGLPYSLAYVARTLVSEVAVTRLLLRLFKVRFDPALFAEDEDRERAVAEVREQVRVALEAVEGLDADRILRALLSTVLAVLRTNAYRHGTDGGLPAHLSFKLDPSQVVGMPQPAPAYEIWVYSPRVEGVHLRFGAVARGGLRWSDRREDFRTEVLGLVKAQIVKNAVIVPTGAKGGFVAKQLPDPAEDREAWRAEGIACYRTFISGLLDVTDDLRPDGDRQVLVPPPGVVRYDGDDPYLVVAADKGTATFSDIANEIAQSRGFWLGDAFASGGSHGYDHKAMGITARGAWESVRRHFRERGVDPQTTDITVVGVGDMSGDVFGNGMLLSEHIRLVAAFDHRHVFLDPDPDPTGSFRERQRLFALPRSSWADYDPALLSPGGGVHSRRAKSVRISPQVAARLGLPDGTTVLSPDELVRAVLRAPVDLFWNGGIGTYVKASTQSHESVGDKANDPVRIDGTDLRVRVVGEGGNLGLTQPGRIEAARSGVGLNTDAIDNSAGVDCSDHEVNIKIMLDRLVARGELDQHERNRSLQRMTDDVARLVLHNNHQQNRTLSVESAFAADLLPAHRRFLEVLEDSGVIDRRLEALPFPAELDRLARDRSGLTTPELSVLLSYAKISLRSALLAGDLPDEAWVRSTLQAYFPPELGERLGGRMAEHPLHREIAATVLVNDVVAAGGLTFAFRAAEETGSDAADVVRAFAVTRHVFALDERSAAVERLDGQVPAAVQALLRHEHQRLLDRAVRWFLQARPEGIDVAREVERFTPTVRSLAARVPELLLGQDLVSLRDRAGQLTAAGVDEREAERTGGLLFVYQLLDITEVAASTGRPAAEVAAIWFAVSERYGFDRLLTAVSSLGRTDRWETLARAALRDDLYALLREFTAAVVSDGAAGSRPDAASDAPAAVATWEADRAPAVRRARQTLGELELADRVDLTALSVALRTLRTVLRRR